MLRASIDLGTNTCLMLIAEVESGQIKKVLGDYARIIRLGEGVDKTRSLQPKAIERTLGCLTEYKKDKNLFPPCVLNAQLSRTNGCTSE